MHKAKIPISIIGLGSYLPERRLTNSDLERLVKTSDEWIMSRTGIAERRLADPTEAASDMALKAALRALEQAQMNPKQIDAVILATSTPDYLFPSTAAIVAGQLGITSPAFDLNAVCSGYLYGLTLAKALIESGLYENILFIATDKMSAFIDYTDRTTCILFGDGASAAVIKASKLGWQIGTSILKSDGTASHLLYVPAGGSRLTTSTETLAKREHFLKMQGRELYKQGVRKMGEVIEECLQKAQISKEEIGWLLFHQANLRMMEATAEHVGIPLSKVYQTIKEYGNTSAASLGITLEALMKKEKNIGKHLLLVAFGAGLTWGAIHLERGDRE